MQINHELTIASLQSDKTTIRQIEFNLGVPTAGILNVHEIKNSFWLWRHAELRRTFVLNASNLDNQFRILYRNSKYLHYDFTKV